MQKQLATITVIMSSHGMVTGAAFHPAQDETITDKSAVSKLLEDVRSQDIKSASPLERMLSSWYKGVKTLTGTITVKDEGTRRIVNSNRLRTVFSVLLVPEPMHQACV